MGWATIGVCRVWVILQHTLGRCGQSGKRGWLVVVVVVGFCVG
jgi:hypothetical protein